MSCPDPLGGAIEGAGVRFAVVIIRSVHSARKNLSSDFFAAARAAAKLGVKRLTAIAAAAQQTRCAIAHHFAPRPGKQTSPWCSAAAPVAPVSLTPARASANILAGQFRRPSGSGGAVLTRTVRELRQNSDSIEIAALSVRFSRFSSVASRDVCAPVCACTRAHIREEKPRTREPFHNVVSYQVVGGSRAVLGRFSSEPRGGASLASCAAGRIGNILAGGYAGLGSIGRRMGVARGRGGESFGVSARARRAARVELGSIELLALVVQAIGRNGGFLRFMGLALGDVGRVMLEGSAQRRGFPPFLRSAHLPVRLASRAPWADGSGGSRAARTPPCAPARPRPVPSMAARQSGRIWIDLRPEAIPGDQRTRIGSRQMGCGNIGSGLWMVAPVQSARGAAGWGLDAAGALRRGGHASKGADRVN